MEMENKTLMNLREHVEKDIEQLIASKPSLSPVEIENAKNAVCLIEKIDDVMRGGKAEYKYETSEGMLPMRHPNYEYSYGWDAPMMHDDGYSGRMHSYARGRDSVTDRYVSRDGRRHSYGYDDMQTSGRRMHGSFAYDSGMSGHSIEDRVIDKIEQMMDSAQSNYERDRLNQFIRVIDSMKGE